MKLYLIGGLGADARVFKFLKLNCNYQIIEWIKPTHNESLTSYANRLKSQINTKEKIGLLGVSFGGIIAIELSKQINPEKLILISSVETDNQLPVIYKRIGKTGILNLIPNILLKPPSFIQTILFGAKNKKLLNEIIRDTCPDFVRWALGKIVHWTNESNSIQPLRIHGTNDRLIPLIGDAIKIKNGGHFMIVDKANEISKLVKEEMKSISSK